MIPAILFPHIDPVIFHIYGPVAIRWYSLAYIAGIIFGIYYLKYISKGFLEISKQALDSLITYIVVGIIIGGRLGYILFYDLHHYLRNPSKILATWEGGMSFHGGIVGFSIAIFLFTRKFKIDFLKLSDLLACSASIGIFFGRIANFINGELYGRITHKSWGVLFPGEVYLRHPSQIYEAIAEGLLNFAILNILFFKSNIRFYKGSLMGLFLVIYSTSRIIIENYREADAQIGYMYNIFTMGQLLSLPILIIGIFFIIKAEKNGYSL